MMQKISATVVIQAKRLTAGLLIIEVSSFLLVKPLPLISLQGCVYVIVSHHPQWTPDVFLFPSFPPLSPNRCPGSQAVWSSHRTHWLWLYPKPNQNS